jgi:putative redox protein
MKITAKNIKNFQVQIEAGNHSFIADEPFGIGDDAGPDPYSLLLSALGSCKVMTVLMYARKKGWPLENVEVSLNIHKSHAKDCENCETDPEARISVIEADLTLEGDLTEEQIKRLGEISEHCPVHRTLSGEIQITTKLGTTPLKE